MVNVMKNLFIKKRMSGWEYFVVVWFMLVIFSVGNNIKGNNDVVGIGMVLVIY